MVFNPAGFQPIYGREYDIVTGMARATISGGQFCFSSGGAAPGSVASSFDPQTAILLAPLASGNQVTGIALFNAGSNQPVAVARRGTFLVSAGGTVVSAGAVDVDGNDAVIPTANSSAKCGRALVGGASGAFALVDLNTA